MGTESPANRRAEPGARKARAGLPRDGAARVYRRAMLLGGLVAALGAFIAWMGIAGGLVAIVFGAGFVAIGASGWLRRPAAQAIHAAVNLFTLGQLGEAERLLERAERSYWLGPNRGSLLHLRAMIALRRGDLPVALAHAEAAVRHPLGVSHRAAATLQRVSALAIRALVRASLGDAAGAVEDAAAVRASPDALPSSLGRAALAEAIVLERAGEREALRALLVERRTVLLEGTTPRERSIVRAYQRLVKVNGASVYRQGATPEAAPAAEEPLLADWVSKVAPGAVAFVRGPTATAKDGASVPAPSTTDEARGAVKKAREQVLPGSRARRLGSAVARVAVLFGLAGVLFLGLWRGDALDDALRQGALPEGSTPGDVLQGFFPFLSVGLASVCAAGVLFLGLQIVDGRRQGRRLIRAVAASPSRPEHARVELQVLTRCRYAMLRAQAHLQLASLAERDGDVDALLDHCTRGIGEATTPNARGLASDVVLPALSAERAFGLVARERFDEAHAELESLPAGFPLLAYVRFRVRLAELVRRGDLASARRYLEQEAHDLPLGPRDELLGDALRVALAPSSCGAAEVLRVKDELRDAASRRWMEAFAPSLVRAVEHPVEESIEEPTDEPLVRVALPSPVGLGDAPRAAPATDDERAGEEAAAEAESAGARPAARLARA